MKKDPYLIEGPTLISFSGGLTSGYMLYKFIERYEGKLPPETFVTFANTGKEREETLRFVHDCETYFGVKVYWLQWRPKTRGIPLEERFEVVGFNSADREGRIFDELIEKKKYLPNPLTRYCTIELKIRVMSDFMQAQGFDHWSNVIGLRADEMHRVFKAIARNETGIERYKSKMPLANDRVRVEDVRAFWDKQPFTLDLEPYEGNCDLCFLKRRDRRARIMREKPELAKWWIEKEGNSEATKPLGRRFNKEETYSQLFKAVANSPAFPFIETAEDDEFDAECGLHCGGD